MDKSLTSVSLFGTLAGARARRSLVVGLAACLLLLPTFTAPARADYSFKPLAVLGDPIPGGGGIDYTNDFELGRINSRGQIAYGADITSGGEGVFLMDMSGTTILALSGDAAPGGGVYSFGFLGPVSLNDPGDEAFAFLLEPFGNPLGVNAGLYRYSHTTRAVSPLVLPGVTPAPGGGTFAGLYYGTSINNQGSIAFTGVVPADIGPAADSFGLGAGVFLAAKDGTLSKVMRPGDPAPGGETFDLGRNQYLNNRGDVVFEAHLASDTVILLAPPDSVPFGIGGTAIALVRAATGDVQLIARRGDEAPGGGEFLTTWGPLLNNQGQIAFVAALEVPAGTGLIRDYQGNLIPGIDGVGVDANYGVFLNARGTTVAIARPGDPMPGGGTLVSSGGITMEYGINNAGVVSFTATLDNGDTGLYTWSRGSLGLVARTGTVIPGVGTVAALKNPLDFGYPLTYGEAAINERGQIAFQVTLTDGRGVMLLATPK